MHAARGNVKQASRHRAAAGCLVAKARRRARGTECCALLLGVLLVGCVDEATSDEQTDHTHLDGGAPPLDAGGGFILIHDPRRHSDGALAAGPYWNGPSTSDGGDPCADCASANACNFYDAGSDRAPQTFEQAVEVLREYCPVLPPLSIVAGDCGSGARFVHTQTLSGSPVSRGYYSAEGVELASIGFSDIRSLSGCMGATYWPARFECESPRITRLLCGELPGRLMEF